MWRKIDREVYEDNFAKIENIPSNAVFEMDLNFVPRITIAIPTYKRPHLLKETLDSVFGQNDMFGFDVIVVDNNPERGCETEKLMHTYDRSKLSYYKNGENLGLTGNWNRLFTLAKGEYVVMLHDDDLLEQDYIKVLKPAMTKLNDFDCILFEHTKVGAKQTAIKRESIKYLNAKSLVPKDFLFGFTAPLIGGCFRKDTVLSLGGFSEEFYPSLDYEFMVRLSKEGKAVLLSGYPMVKYRVLENESRKTDTILNFLRKDDAIKREIIRESGLNIKLYKSLFKIYSYNYLNTMVNSFKNDDIRLLNRLSQLKESITLRDKLVSSFLTRKQLMKVKLNKKITLKKNEV